MKAFNVPEQLQIEPLDWPTFGNEIFEVEKRSFPPTLRDSRSALKALVESPTSLVLGLRGTDDRLMGYIGGDRLEAFPDIPGIRSDTHFGRNDTLYIETLAVNLAWRHRGYGTELISNFQERAREIGFSRTTAHIETDSAHKIKLRFRTLDRFQDWYQTGKNFDYIELFI